VGDPDRQAALRVGARHELCPREGSTECDVADRLAGAMEAAVEGLDLGEFR
jgi:hypothetical protein